MTFCLKTLKFLNDVETGKHKPVPLLGGSQKHLELEPGRLDGMPVSWQGAKSVIKSCKLCHLNLNFITTTTHVDLFFTRNSPEISPFYVFFFLYTLENTFIYLGSEF